MGQSSSTPSYTSTPPANQEDLEVICRVADEFFDKIETSCKTRGLDNTLEDVEEDLVDLWERGVLKGDNQDFFLLTLFNHSEDGEAVEIPRSLKMRDSKGRHAKMSRVKDLVLRRLFLFPRMAVRTGIKLVLSPADALITLMTKLSKAKQHRTIMEADGRGVLYRNKKFKNWGLNIQTNRIPTFIPKTKLGLCNIVKWAKSKNLQVRVAGYRHSWSNITVNDNQVLVSLLPINQVEKLPATEKPIDPENELQGVELLDEYVEEDGVKKRLCKFGAATTNEQFRQWIVDNSLDKKTKAWSPFWTLPLNVIMVEITFGGSNGPVCHGAGITTTTLSDLVTSIEFVNAKGELQTVDDPTQLKSVSGCFGMLGIVTSITMKLDPQSYARMVPEKKPIALTIPPPKGFDVPKNIDMSGITDKMLEDAFQEFSERCTYRYCEYFWFPGSPRSWINCWQDDGDESDARLYPSPFQAKLQSLSSFLNEIAANTIFKVLPPRFQLKVLTGIAMRVMPERTNDNPIVAPVSEALHFRRGIQNMRVNDTEWEIPIPGIRGDPSKPDYSVIQKAWWVIIKNFYDRYNKSRNDVPMQLPLEMRITGGSSVNIAPQYGNEQHGTCSIEVLTPQNVDKEEWNDFMQETANAWLNLEYDDGTKIHPFKNEKGNLVHVRPHWAKEWDTLKGPDNEPIQTYLKEKAYKDQIPIFRAGLAAAAASGGYTLQDAETLFSNKFTREMFGPKAL